MRKPEITYPCRWGYRIIGTSRKAIRAAVDEVVVDAEHTLDVSNTSATGKYVSFRLEVLVRDEPHRLGIHQVLSELGCVKIVL